MRFVRTGVVAGTLVAGLAATPASAAPVFAGFTCGFASTNDRTGIVNQDPNVANGVAFSYFYVGDTVAGAATSVRIDCWVQVNNAIAGEPGGTGTVSGETSGAVGSVAGVVTYTAGATDNVYVCSRVTAQFADGSQFVFVEDEDDNAANGSQCPLTVATGEGQNAEQWDRETSAGEVGDTGDVHADDLLRDLLD